MANITPFIGLRYNNEKVNNLTAVVTPPYDIIDEKEQARYYAEHPANIIRLELGLVFPDDDESNNRYTRAHQYLERWIEDEILSYESKPALYLYQQEFKAHDTSMVRNGFICGLKVEDYAQGNILPHEETLSKPKADRLQLMRATQSNFSSIFGLYSDTENVVQKALFNAVEVTEPDIEIYDEVNEAHRIWAVTNEEAIQTIVNFMQDQQIFIADGHHRYETALEYAREMKAAGHEGYDYVMTTLVNMFDPGLVILPTHRMVGDLQDLNLQALREQLEAFFNVRPFGSKEQLPDLLAEMTKPWQEKHLFGMYDQTGHLYLLELKDAEAARNQLPTDRSDAWKGLDVAVLDNLILDHILGIGAAERREQKNVEYTKDAREALTRVDQGDHQLAFILNPTRIDEIIAVARAGDKMPQKATYFYPKLLTGLVINPLYKNLP